MSCRVSALDSVRLIVGNGSQQPQSTALRTERRATFCETPIARDTLSGSHKKEHTLIVCFVSGHEFAAHLDRVRRVFARRVH